MTHPADLTELIREGHLALSNGDWRADAWTVFLRDVKAPDDFDPDSYKQLFHSVYVASGECSGAAQRMDRPQHWQL